MFSEEPDDIASAKQICNSCDARPECLAYALGADVTGTWGGFTEPERQEILKNREKHARLAQTGSRRSRDRPT